jgi:peptide/nickel transport system ATP-binding protein/oligopeptide transport system ATP-binding protein
VALLEVRDLKTHFFTEEGVVKAVDGISFHVDKGEVLGIVGESGSGKSVASLSILRLIPDPPGRIVSGQILLEEGGQMEDLVKASERRMQQVRGDRVAMIFQDPMTSLNPYLRVSEQLCEVLELHKGMNRKQARKRGIEMMREVGIPGAETRFDDYPHQLSGGMRQRVMIAMALLCEPELLIADEPTTALDVTIQAQILELIKERKEALGAAVMLITHDLGVVARMADRVAVMYAGRIVEEGPVDVIFGDPRHPYTIGLARSIPRLDEAKGDKLVPIPGLPPSLAKVPSGCPFHPRCPEAIEVCRQDYPARRTVGSEGTYRVTTGNSPHTVSCHVEDASRMKSAAALRLRREGKSPVAEPIVPTEVEG